MRVLSRLAARRHRLGAVLLVAGLAAALAAGLAPAPRALAEGPRDWMAEFPSTDFAKRSVEYSEFRFDGARRDTIPPIDEPRFRPSGEITGIGRLEPVLSVAINGDFRAYPLRVLLWHEIVNDVVGGVPVLVSYCPLCNSGVVYERTVEDKPLSFGNTGRVRHFDMVMYDRETESWWQQFTGRAIMGTMTGARLKPVPSRVESLERFRERATGGRVLVPADPRLRPYGTTPYVKMDTARDTSGRYPYGLPAGVRPLDRVVTVGDEAWTLALLRDEKMVETEDLVLMWEPGQNSIHDTKWIAFGRDVGNVVVQRKTDQGTLEDVPYDVGFAFVFAAFMPGRTLHHR